MRNVVCPRSVRTRKRIRCKNVRIVTNEEGVKRESVCAHKDRGECFVKKLFVRMLARPPTMDTVSLIQACKRRWKTEDFLVFVIRDSSRWIVQWVCVHLRVMPSMDGEDAIIPPPPVLVRRHPQESIQEKIVHDLFPIKPLPVSPSTQSFGCFSSPPWPGKQATYN